MASRLLTWTLFTACEWPNDQMSDVLLNVEWVSFTMLGIVRCASSLLLLFSSDTNLSLVSWAHILHCEALELIWFCMALLRWFHICIHNYCYHICGMWMHNVWWRRISIKWSVSNLVGRVHQLCMPTADRLTWINWSINDVSYTPIHNLPPASSASYSKFAVIRTSRKQWMSDAFDSSTHLSPNATRNPLVDCTQNVWEDRKSRILGSDVDGTRALWVCAIQYVHIRIPKWLPLDWCLATMWECSVYIFIPLFHISFNLVWQPT